MHQKIPKASLITQNPTKNSNTKMLATNAAVISLQSSILLTAFHPLEPLLLKKDLPIFFKINYSFPTARHCFWYAPACPLHLPAATPSFSAPVEINQTILILSAQSLKMEQQFHPLPQSMNSSFKPPIPTTGYL